MIFIYCVIFTGYSPDDFKILSTSTSWTNINSLATIASTILTTITSTSLTTISSTIFTTIDRTSLSSSTKKTINAANAPFIDQCQSGFTCPISWTIVGSIGSCWCYLIPNTTLNFSRATSYCQNIGGALMV